MSYGTYHNYGADRVPGGRREKLKGYLKAANELRQSYQEQIAQKLSEGGDERMPGEFPDVEIVRNGEEEMLLFPSYARLHLKRRGAVDQGDLHLHPGAQEGIERPVSSGDAEYWKREWEKYEDANAIVDVDVRGWIYTPQRGPLNRKSRLLVAVARRLSGIPPPAASPVGSRDASPHPDARRRGALSNETHDKHEDAAADREAQRIARRGEKEVAAAERGGYSLEVDPNPQPRGPSPRGGNSREPSPFARGRQGNGTDSEVTTDDEDPGQFSLIKRYSWTQTPNMSKEEQLKANDLLMARLRPFMTHPLAHTTITVFFFNEMKSTSKSVTTNESGHFNLRAALDFVPAQVRVLASENLSATEDVIISDPRGVSLVSDIDDTIKHSAIASGAREIFKNTFIRELSDLTIKGVKEWYGTLASMGVQLHYVSNSPWQLYPVLRSYFKLAGIPSGSFHLKQYTGMLQGIFEPAAERKKGSLERIMSDFPDRKFVLVGDSGEADLEVYTDVVLSHPGKILAVFIRDVTTPNQHGFFDQAIFKHQSHHTEEHVEKHDDHSDAIENRPTLPTRLKPSAEKPTEPEDLIDFSEETDTAAKQDANKESYATDLQQLSTKPAAEAPTKPPKPSNLRNFSSSSPVSPNPNSHGRTVEPTNENGVKKSPPPKPRRPSSTVDTSNVPLFSGFQASYAPFAAPPPQHQQQQGRHASEPSQPPDLTFEKLHRTNTSTSIRSLPPNRNEEGYATAATRRINTAYNTFPTLRSQSPSREGTPTPHAHGPPQQPPTLRRAVTQLPSAAVRHVTGATGGDPAAGGDGGAAPGQPYNKKEEMWKRRWARSSEIMRANGVVLRTWRVGADVMDDCVKIVDRALRDMGIDPGEYAMRSPEREKEKHEKHAGGGGLRHHHSLHKHLSSHGSR